MGVRPDIAIVGKDFAVVSDLRVRGRAELLDHFWTRPSPIRSTAGHVSTTTAPHVAGVVVDVGDFTSDPAITLTARR